MKEREVNFTFSRRQTAVNFCMWLPKLPMKTRLGNTRPATKAPLYYIEKVYIYSVICTQYNTNPYLNKEKVKLYLHLATVSDVSEYGLKITAFCLFLKTWISLLRLKLNPANTNIIRLLSK